MITNILICSYVLLEIFERPDQRSMSVHNLGTQEQQSFPSIVTILRDGDRAIIHSASCCLLHFGSSLMHQLLLKQQVFMVAA